MLVSEFNIPKGLVHQKKHIFSVNLNPFSVKTQKELFLKKLNFAIQCRQKDPTIFHCSDLQNIFGVQQKK